jgi:hypothetical protein
LLALYDFFWGLGTQNQGLLVALPGGPQIQLTGDTECGVVITFPDGTGKFFPGYFAGVTSEVSNADTSGVPFDSLGGRSVSIIPFDPGNPKTPRALSIPLQDGSLVQNTGSLPSVGVYTNSTISNALSPGQSITSA